VSKRLAPPEEIRVASHRFGSIYARHRPLTFNTNVAERLVVISHTTLH
jgi:hypothetical protein